MELLQLRYFATVAQMLNISQAAKHHRIPQPAMSQTVSKLEKELGTKLFDRYKNRLSLTQAGKTFYEAVHSSLQALDNGLQQLSSDDTVLRGELKILVRQHRDTVVDCIMAFKREHPEVSFVVSYQPDMPRTPDFDLCIACQQPDESFDDSTLLITEALKLVVSGKHWAAKESVVPFSRLEGEEFAAISPDSNAWVQTLLQCRQAGFQPRMSISCADLHCLLKYVGEGMAITVGPEVAWRGLPRENVAFVATDPAIFRSTYVFSNSRRTPSRLAEKFRSFLQGYFARLHL